MDRKLTSRQPCLRVYDQAQSLGRFWRNWCPLGTLSGQENADKERIYRDDGTQEDKNHYAHDQCGNVLHRGPGRRDHFGKPAIKVNPIRLLQVRQEFWISPQIAPMRCPRRARHWRWKGNQLRRSRFQLPANFQAHVFFCTQILDLIRYCV